MLEDISFDASSDKLVWGSIFTGIGFTLGMSCLLVQCVRRQCRKRKRRRPIVKTLGVDDSSDSSSSDEESAGGIELTSPPLDSDVEVKVDFGETQQQLQVNGAPKKSKYVSPP
jgi:hypothetical protein